MHAKKLTYIQLMKARSVKQQQWPHHHTWATFKWGISSSAPPAGVVHCHLHFVSITPSSKIACGDNFTPVWEPSARVHAGQYKHPTLHVPREMSQSAWWWHPICPQTMGSSFARCKPPNTCSSLHPKLSAQKSPASVASLDINNTAVHHKATGDPHEWRLNNAHIN